MLTFPVWGAHTHKIKHQKLIWIMNLSTEAHGFYLITHTHTHTERQITIRTMGITKTKQKKYYDEVTSKTIFFGWCFLLWALIKL